ncbi:Ankyrin repeat domain-containing protein 12, partial [Armadillidium nasatum]
EEPGTGINSNNNNNNNNGNNNNNNNNMGTSISTSGAISSTNTASINTTTSTTAPSMNMSSNSSGNGSSNITSTNTSSDKGSATRITRSQRGGGSGGSGSGSGSNSNEEVTVKSEVKSEEQMTPSDVVHPRKRKLKMKEPEMENPLPVTAPEQPVTNCYEMFLKIRKQVEKRRKLLFPVQPKPPQGFKDYLMNRCSYVLANSSTSQVSVPVIPAPASLSQALKDLFNEQEQERYKLRLQQLIEKEKLVLSVEQEILRVHGRAARALANQVVPFSVCTILKDEEVYNVISPEQEEKDRNARSRYNGRLFLSWLQDVDDKWEKIKEAMVLRHHNEAESLHAVQKMDWEWKLKEIGLLEPTVKTQIDEMHVPMVQVADFDLLPA